MRSVVEERDTSYTFGQRLRRARVNLGWDQKELASRSGVAQSAISQYEKGSRENPTLEQIIKLQAALGISLVDAPDATRRDKDLKVRVANAQRVLEQYLASDFAQAQKPAKAELEWLQSIVEIRWVGKKEPNAETLYHMIEALRKS
jgi:transcriptional regulator with XRE-family HTH domain